MSATPPASMGCSPTTSSDPCSNHSQLPGSSDRRWPTRSTRCSHTAPGSVGSDWSIPGGSCWSFASAPSSGAVRWEMRRKHARRQENGTLGREEERLERESAVGWVMSRGDRCGYLPCFPAACLILYLKKLSQRSPERIIDGGEMWMRSIPVFQNPTSRAHQPRAQQVP